MEIIAIRGTRKYLVRINEKLGIVYDVNEDTLFPPFNLNSILARGYWEEYTGSQDQLLEKIRSKIKQSDFLAIDQNGECIDLRTAKKSIVEPDDFTGTRNPTRSILEKDE